MLAGKLEELSQVDDINFFAKDSLRALIAVDFKHFLIRLRMFLHNIYVLLIAIHELNLLFFIKFDLL